MQANDTCILTSVSSAPSHAQIERDGDQQVADWGGFSFCTFVKGGPAQEVWLEESRERMKMNVCKLFVGSA